MPTLCQDMRFQLMLSLCTRASGSTQPTASTHTQKLPALLLLEGIQPRQDSRATEGRPLKPLESGCTSTLKFTAVITSRHGVCQSRPAPPAAPHHRQSVCQPAAGGPHTSCQPCSDPPPLPLDARPGVLAAEAPPAGVPLLGGVAPDEAGVPPGVPPGPPTALPGGAFCAGEAAGGDSSTPELQQHTGCDDAHASQHSHRGHHGRLCGPCLVS